MRGKFVPIINCFSIWGDNVIKLGKLDNIVVNNIMVVYDIVINA